MKKFYIETFGCQMNAHDSEKVIGTLLSRGYSQVENPADADLLLYNTCSIRDKAEQKVFHRLDQFKREHAGKTFGVLGCVAQQEGDKIFERSPHVSLVCGSASYNKLPELLVQLETGNRRVTGLSLDTDETFETPVTRRDNPHEPTSQSSKGATNPVRIVSSRLPAVRSVAAPRKASCERRKNSLAKGYTEIQLLGQNVNSYRDPSPAGLRFRSVSAGCGQRRRHSPGQIHYVASSRFCEGDYRRDR